MCSLLKMANDAQAEQCLLNIICTAVEFCSRTNSLSRSEHEETHLKAAEEDLAVVGGLRRKQRPHRISAPTDLILKRSESGKKGSASVSINSEFCASEAF